MMTAAWKPMPTPAILHLDNASKSYGSGDTTVHAISNVNLCIQRGDYVAVMGPSGSGKTTLMNIVGCLDTLTSGRYLFDGEDVSAFSEPQLARVRNRRIGFVFQQFHLLPRLSAWRNVELPLVYRNASDRRERAMAALEMVELSHRVEHRPTELSGGQQQRVAIARALVTDPDLILADEPTGNLDSTSTAGILSLLRSLNVSGRSILMITHEADVAAAANRAIHMRDGRFVEETG